MLNHLAMLTEKKNRVGGRTFVDRTKFRTIERARREEQSNDRETNLRGKLRRIVVSRVAPNNSELICDSAAHCSCKLIRKFR